MPSVLRKPVVVDPDPARQAGNGALITLPAGTPRGEIPEHELAQLCDEHFTDREDN